MLRSKKLVVALVGILVLCISAVAYAGSSSKFDPQSQTKYTVTKGKKPTGLHVKGQLKDPGATPKGYFPYVNTATIKFPGSKFNYKAAPVCKKAKADAAKCPADTLVGTGKSNGFIRGVNTATGQPQITPVKTTVRSYNRKGGQFFVAKAVGLPVTIILKGNISKGLTQKFNLKRDIPPLPGGNRSDLSTVDVKLKKITSGKGKKKKTMYRTPKCGKSKRIKTVFSLTYADHKPSSKTVKQKCTK